MNKDEEKIKITMFVKDGCGACKAAKERIGGLLNDLTEELNIEIITTNPKIAKSHNLQFAPTMRFNDEVQHQLIGNMITAKSVLDTIRQLKFKE